MKRGSQQYPIAIVTHAIQFLKFFCFLAYEILLLNKRKEPKIFFCLGRPSGAARMGLAHMHGRATCRELGHTPGTVLAGRSHHNVRHLRRPDYLAGPSHSGPLFLCSADHCIVPTECFSLDRLAQHVDSSADLCCPIPAIVMTIHLPQLGRRLSRDSSVHVPPNAPKPRTHTVSPGHSHIIPTLMSLPRRIQSLRLDMRLQ